MNDTELIYAFLASLSAAELNASQLSALAAPFGMTETNLRSSLSRMHARGLIEIRKGGRAAFYRLAERGKRIGANVSLHFRDPDWSGWDGTFWAAAFSLPDSRGRYRLQKKLHAYGFRPLYAGLWIRPLNPAEPIPSVFQEHLDKGDMDMFRCSFERELTAERISALYGLREIGAALKGALRAARQSAASASLHSPDAAFVERMNLGDGLVNAMARDPLLPPALLPAGWPAAELRRAFKKWIETYSKRSMPFVRRALEMR